MTRAEARHEKRKDVVEAVVIHNEPVALLARIYNIPRRTVFSGWPGVAMGAGMR